MLSGGSAKGSVMQGDILRACTCTTLQYGPTLAGLYPAAGIALLAHSLAHGLNAAWKLPLPGYASAGELHACCLMIARPHGHMPTAWRLQLSAWVHTGRVPCE